MTKMKEELDILGFDQVTIDINTSVCLKTLSEFVPDPTI